MMSKEKTLKQCKKNVIAETKEEKKMQFCRFCGKELVNGQCDCADFQASIGNAGNAGNQAQYQQTYQQSYQQQQYQQPYQKRHEPFLIQSFHPNFTSFSGFVSSVRDMSGISEPTSNSGDPFEYNVPIVPDCISPEENEVVVKQYNIAKLRTRMKFMKAEGRLMVTNRRVIFRAAGTSLTGNLLQEHQFNLDELAGIEMHKDYKFSLLNFLGSILVEVLAIFLAITLNGRVANGASVLLGIILGIIGIAPSIIVYKHHWLKLLFAAFSVASFFMAMQGSGKGKGFFIFLMVIAGIFYIADLLVVCFVPNLVIKVKVKGAIPAINIGSQKSLLARLGGQTGEYSGFVEVLPWEDTIMAMNELGTMIDDLQKQGDYAIEKWSR